VVGGEERRQAPVAITLRKELRQAVFHPGHQPFDHRHVAQEQAALHGMYSVYGDGGGGWNQIDLVRGVRSG